MGKPHELPMLRGRNATHDDFIRWGQTTVQNFTPTALVTQSAPPNQMVKAHLDFPQTWSLFLFANLLTGVPANGTSQLSWKITLGAGTAQNTFVFRFLYDVTVATPVEQYDLIKAGNALIFKELEFPAKDVQVTAEWLVTPGGPSPAAQSLEIGCYCAPRVLHGYR